MEYITDRKQKETTIFTERFVLTDCIGVTGVTLQNLPILQKTTSPQKLWEVCWTFEVLYVSVGRYWAYVQFRVYSVYLQLSIILQCS